MKHLIAIPLILSVLCSACAASLAKSVPVTPIPGQSQDQLNSDMKECEQAAHNRLPDASTADTAGTTAIAVGTAVGLATALAIPHGAFLATMTAGATTLGANEQLAQPTAQLETDLLLRAAYRTCMEQRGYTLKNK